MKPTRGVIRSRCRLQGTVAAEEMPDLIDYVSKRLFSGYLNLAWGAHEGVLRFQNGQLVSARTGNLTGEEAFYCILAFGDSFFTFVESGDVPVVEITRDVTALLLEGTRLMDERGREEILRSKNRSGADVYDENLGRVLDTACCPSGPVDRLDHALAGVADALLGVSGVAQARTLPSGAFDEAIVDSGVDLPTRLLSHVVRNVPLLEKHMGCVGFRSAYLATSAGRYVFGMLGEIAFWVQLEPSASPLRVTAGVQRVCEDHKRARGRDHTAHARTRMPLLPMQTDRFRVADVAPLHPRSRHHSAP